MDGVLEDLEVQTSRGMAYLQELARGVLLYRVVGHGDERHFQSIAVGLERAIKARGSIEWFADASQLQGYETKFRTGWTNWLLANRSKFSDMHVLVLSKFARMGLSVANLATSGMLRSYDSIASFDAAIKKRVPGWKRLAAS